jgi:hypothetical protein
MPSVTRVGRSNEKPIPEQEDWMCERAAIANLLADYTFLLDDADFAGLGQMFEHGRVTIDGGPRNGETGSGPSGVAALYRSLVAVEEASSSPRTHHLTGNLHVTFDEGGTRAIAKSYFCVLQQTATLSLQPVSGGIYRDVLVKVGDGWHFEQRIITCDQVGDLSEHLAHAAGTGH